MNPRDEDCLYNIIYIGQGSMNPRDKDCIYILQLIELHLLAFNTAAKLTKTIKTDGEF